MTKRKFALQGQHRWSHDFIVLRLVHFFLPLIITGRSLAYKATFQWLDRFWTALSRRTFCRVYSWFPTNKDCSAAYNTLPLAEGNLKKKKEGKYELWPSDLLAIKHLRLWYLHWTQNAMTAVVIGTSRGIEHGSLKCSLTGFMVAITLTRLPLFGPPPPFCLFFVLVEERHELCYCVVSVWKVFYALAVSPFRDQCKAALLPHSSAVFTYFKPLWCWDHLSWWPLHEALMTAHLWLQRAQTHWCQSELCSALFFLKELHCIEALKCGRFWVG